MILNYLCRRARKYARLPALSQPALVALLLLWAVQAVAQQPEKSKFCASPAASELAIRDVRDSAKFNQLLAVTQDDRVIVPGERIGAVRLSNNIDEVFKLFGRGTEKRQGHWTGSLLCTWDSLGLWIIFDKETGNILWISIDASGSSTWASELATVNGIRLGIKTQQLLAILGKPDWRFTAGPATSLYYDRRGIRLTISDYGPLAGTVGSIRIIWPAVPRGDTLIVPGERISSVDVGTPINRALELLGGGYLRGQRKGAFIYYWPHLGLSLVEQSRHVTSIRAARDRPSDAANIKYTTAEGLGIGSSTADIKAVYGEPSETKSRQGIQWQIYRSRGIAIAYGFDSRARLIDVFPPEGR